MFAARDKNIAQTWLHNHRVLQSRSVSKWNILELSFMTSTFCTGSVNRTPTWKEKTKKIRTSPTNSFLNLKITQDKLRFSTFFHEMDCTTTTRKQCRVHRDCQNHFPSIYLSASRSHFIQNQGQIYVFSSLSLETSPCSPNAALKQQIQPRDIIFRISQTRAILLCLISHKKFNIHSGILKTWNFGSFRQMCLEQKAFQPEQDLDCITLKPIYH